ncbi:MAG: hypothetical protein KDC26_05525 [Armatimonadetes bacterium]|nr:hypothetical protein [Armatimonadota bacterium]
MANRPNFQFGSTRPLGRSVTMILLICFIAGFVLSWIPSIGEFLRTWFGVVLDSETSGNFWSLFTYPFVEDGSGGALFFTIIGWMWWYGIGNELERIGGSRNLVVHFVAFTLIVGLFHMIAFFTKITPFVVLLGPFLVVSILAVMWAALAPLESMCLMGLVTFQRRWYALIITAIVFFGYGTGNPVMGLIAALPCGIAWIYGRGFLPISYTGKSMIDKKIERDIARRKNEEFDQFIGKVREKEKDREEKERLRKLFEGSLEDDSSAEK